MNSTDFLWDTKKKRFSKDAHALFGASNYHWTNYDIDKMIQVYTNSKAKTIGTQLHELACMLITQKVKLPDVEKTLNMHVNDAIELNLRPEEQLYYSDTFFGTADAIGIVNDILHIHDLKTGKIKANVKQLEIYTSFFLLQYGLIPRDFKDIELRIYQNDEVIVHHPTTEDLVPIMDKIVTVNDIFEKMKENEYA